MGRCDKQLGAKRPQLASDMHCQSLGIEYSPQGATISRASFSMEIAVSVQVHWYMVLLSQSRVVFDITASKV